MITLGNDPSFADGIYFKKQIFMDLGMNRHFVYVCYYLGERNGKV